MFCIFRAMRPHGRVVVRRNVLVTKYIKRANVCGERQREREMCFMQCIRCCALAERATDGGENRQCVGHWQESTSLKGMLQCLFWFIFRHLAREHKRQSFDKRRSWSHQWNLRLFFIHTTSSEVFLIYRQGHSDGERGLKRNFRSSRVKGNEFSFEN